MGLDGQPEPAEPAPQAEENSMPSARVQGSASIRALNSAGTEESSGEELTGGGEVTGRWR